MNQRSEPQPGAGHNRPPEDPLVLQEQNLTEKHRQLRARCDELLADVEKAPEVLTDEAAAGLMQDFKKQILTELKRINRAFRDEKDPINEAGRLVDRFFQALSGPLDGAKETLTDRLTAYQLAKEKAERKAREEAERKAREEAAEAERKAAEAAALMLSDDDLTKALEAEEEAAEAAAQAAQAADAAAAPVADLSRVRGDLGSTGSLRGRWKHRNLKRAELDLEALRPHLSTECLDKAIRSFIAANKQALDDPEQTCELVGVELYKDYRAQ